VTIMVAESGKRFHAGMFEVKAGTWERMRQCFTPGPGLRIPGAPAITHRRGSVPRGRSQDGRPCGEVEMWCGQPSHPGAVPSPILHAPTTSKAHPAKAGVAKPRVLALLSDADLRVSY
jgi:hypothetical protein